MALVPFQNRLGPTACIGKNWASRWVGKQPDFKAKYIRKYDHQRAKCENPKTIKAWVALVQNTIAKYGILKSDRKPCKGSTAR